MNKKFNMETYFSINKDGDCEGYIDGVAFVTEASQALLTLTHRYIFGSIFSMFGKIVAPPD